MSRLADRLAAVDLPAAGPIAVGELPRLMARGGRPPFWRRRGLLVIVASMAAIGLAMVAGSRYAASPSVPSRTATQREDLPTEPRPAPGPKAPELRDRALGAMAQGHIAEAAGLLAEVVAATPRDALAWHALGVASARLGNLAAAVEALGRAVELRPDGADARRDLAVALDRAGRDREAAAHYGAFLERADPGAAGADDVRRRLGELRAPGAGR